MSKLERRYLDDPVFHHVVDSLEHMIVKAQLAPSEVREAAMLAVIHYEMRTGRHLFYADPEATVTGLDRGPKVPETIEEAKDQGWQTYREGSSHDWGPTFKTEIEGVTMVAPPLWHFRHIEARKSL